MSWTTFSAGSFKWSGLLSHLRSYERYDEPETLPYSIRPFCPMSADGGQSKEFLEAGKRRLAGDTARAATSGEVKDLRRQAQELKAVVAEQALELRLLKKSMIADGGDEE